MYSRREFIKAAGMAAGGCLLGGTALADAGVPSGNLCRMPAEFARHQRTWMAFGASRKLWGQTLFPKAQDHLAAIARAIAEYEPVSMLVPKSDYKTAVRKCGTGNIEFISCPLDDLWMRDMGPVFVRDPSGKKAAVDFNFNGWGHKQTYSRDAKVAAFVAAQAQVERLQTRLILDGGAIEVDGQGTAILAESCVLNPNRNPGLDKPTCEAELARVLGVQKTIWLPGMAGQDITDGHTDFYARFVRPGVVVAGYEPNAQYPDHTATKKNIEFLRSATDSTGHLLEVVVIEAPATVRPRFASRDFAAGYANFYMVNDAVLIPEFGDAQADDRAKGTLAGLFPDRKIVALNIDAIAAGGGGIHCTTQQEYQLSED